MMITMPRFPLFHASQRRAALALILGAACLAAPVRAEQRPQADTEAEEGAMVEPRIATGDSARDWLQRQSSRKQASRTRQTLSGPAMSNVNKRYVDSFATPMTETPLRAMTPASRQ